MRFPSRTDEPWSTDAKLAFVPFALPDGYTPSSGFSARNARPHGEYQLAPVGPMHYEPEVVSPIGDAKLAVVFRQIRAIHALSEIEMARRLGTGIDVVLSFEAGTVDQLPPWPDTARIVERYADFGGVDPAPLLSRLLSLQTLPFAPPPVMRGVPTPTVSYPPQALLEGVPAKTVQIYASPAATPFATSQQDGGPIGFAARPRLKGEPTTGRPRPLVSDIEPADEGVVAARRRRRLRRTALALSPLLGFVVIFIMLHASPRSVYAVARTLPGPLETATRGVIDLMMVQTATFKDGMRWIEIEDPRLRKSQRLSSR